MSNIDIILEDALKNRKLMVYYQPIYDTKSEKYRSAEALLRLKDERFGFIPPDVFIAAAEKSGAIHRVGSYVLEEVCKFMSEDEFKDLGLDYIEVNLSAVECMQSNLITKVLPVLDQYHVEADKVNLEITETAVGDMESVIEKNVDELNDSGIKFSLDDYGTGYSNITRIAKLPFSLIKIDKSLTTSVFNPNMRIVVENTVHMIKDLDMKIVVEGVETEELAKYFTNLKCDYIQGFYYCKPLPKDEFIKFIKDAA
jgi:EAL domain-containing protein (putative c-di-GMP-specific phosphodiesterase class I)